MNNEELFERAFALIINVSLIIVIAILFFSVILIYPKSEPKPAKAKTSSQMIANDFIQDTGYQIVNANCTGCHSSKLVTQNRATREGWKNMIIWMQETQNLWDLGENEKVILDYLSKNYAPRYQGRRAPLPNIDWYQLEQ